MHSGETFPPEVWWQELQNRRYPCEWRSLIGRGRQREYMGQEGVHFNTRDEEKDSKVGVIRELLPFHSVQVSHLSDV